MRDRIIVFADHGMYMPIFIFGWCTLCVTARKTSFIQSKWNVTSNRKNVINPVVTWDIIIISLCVGWKVYVSAVYGVISWGTTIRFMTCRAALQRFRDFTKLSCAAGPRFRKPFLSWRESRALPLKFVQSRYGLGQHCMCNNVVAHLWFWPSFVTVFVVLMLCVKAHSL